MAPHPTGKLGADDGAALIDLDVVLAAAESVLNDTLHFEKIALTHVLRLIRSFTAAEPDTAGPPMQPRQRWAFVPHPGRFAVFPSNSPATFPATLFDYNGVLANDETVHLAAFQDALVDLGITLTEADYWQKYLGFDDVGAFSAILTDAGRPADAAHIAELVAAKRPLYRARAEAALPLFSGAAELIRQRAAAGPVGIVSGALRDEIELGLQALGVKELIATVIAAEDTRASKPNPHGYELGIAALSKLVRAEDAQRALVIEDSLAGIEAAKSAGLPCVAVGHSYPQAELYAHGADLVVAELAHIDPPTLAALFRKLYG
jgi:beta-phosphoglucomutase